MAKPKHILVIRLSAMGDVAMLVPVLSALRLQYPDLKISVLTKGFFAPFFRNIDNVSIINADLKGRHKGVLGLLKLSKELKKLNINAVADCHNVLRSKILKVFLSGYQCVQINKGRAEKKALTSGEKFQQLKTTHQRYADIFSQLGYPVDLTNPVFPKPADLNPSIKSLINSEKKDWIGIAPFAAFESKSYPLDQMEEVILELSKDYAVLLLGGGEREIALLNWIEQKFENVTNLAGKLSLSEEMDVMSNCKLMIAMDSGNAHIAAMLGLKVITIWGVTHPYAGFAPFYQPELHQLLPDRNKYPLIPTSVYGNKYPENYKLVAGSISVKTVVEKVNEVLK